MLRRSPWNSNGMSGEISPALRFCKKPSNSVFFLEGVAWPFGLLLLQRDRCIANHERKSNCGIRIPNLRLKLSTLFAALRNF